MSVKVQSNVAKIIVDTKQRASVGLRLMLDAIDDISTPKTPKRLGDLRQMKRKQVLGLRGSIIWLSSHAIFQETKQFKNYTTPGTGPHFAEQSVAKVVKNSDLYFKKAGMI